MKSIIKSMKQIEPFFVQIVMEFNALMKRFFFFFWYIYKTIYLQINSKQYINMPGFFQFFRTVWSGHRSRGIKVDDNVEKENFRLSDEGKLSDEVSVGQLPCVQKAEAATLVWGRTALYFTCAWICVCSFLVSFPFFD